MRSHNHCFHTKAISITYSQSMSATLLIMHANSMRRIILSSVARMTPLYSSTLPNKRHDFRGKKKRVYEHKMF